MEPETTHEKQTSLLNPNADPYCGGRTHPKAFPPKIDYFVRPPVYPYGSNFTHPFAVSVSRYTCEPNEYQAATLYFQPCPVVEYYDASTQLGTRSSLSSPDRPKSLRKTKTKMLSNGGGVVARKWMPKGTVGPRALEKKSKYCSSSLSSKAKTMAFDTGPSRSVIPFPEDCQELERSGTTTVMMKNIPNQFRRIELLRILANHCKIENEKAESRFESFRSEFDFVYLPMDFRKFWDEKKVANLGYAFVNFTTTTAASLFYKCFHMREWGVLKNNKTCHVTCAKIQGREALCESFKGKIFHCHTNEYLPLILQPPCDGSSMPRGKIIGKRSGEPPRYSIRESLEKGK